jgi:tetratricopeptide (TPR) repeat protein
VWGCTGAARAGPAAPGEVPRPCGDPPGRRPGRGARDARKRGVIYYDWDWETAEHGFRRALEIDPRWATRELYAVYFLAARGRFEEAQEQLAWSRTLAVTPVPLVAYPALVRYLAREPAAALEEADAALAMAPELAIAHWFRGLALEASGRVEAALASFHRASELTHHSSLMLAQVARALARAGRAGEARSVLEEVAARNERWGPAPCFRAHRWQCTARIRIWSPG